MNSCPNVILCQSLMFDETTNNKFDTYWIVSLNYKTDNDTVEVKCTKDLDNPEKDVWSFTLTQDQLNEMNEALTENLALTNTLLIHPSGVVCYGESNHPLKVD